jgi:hypothetical protein
MLRPKRRLFRRRTTSEWIKDYAYAGVTLLALAGGAVAWGALFNDERPQPGYRFAAPPEPVAVASAQSPLTPVIVPSPAAEPSPPPTSDVTAPASAKEPAAATHKPVQKPRLSFSSKSPAVARPSRRVLASSVGASRRDHKPTRLARVHAKPQTYASATPVDERAYEELIDHASVLSAQAPAPRAPQQEAVSLPAPKIERESRSEDCSRLSHTFGGMRSVRSECSSGDASGQNE